MRSVVIRGGLVSICSTSAEVPFGIWRWPAVRRHGRRGRTCDARGCHCRGRWLSAGRLPPSGIFPHRQISDHRLGPECLPVWGRGGKIDFKPICLWPSGGGLRAPQTMLDEHYDYHSTRNRNALFERAIAATVRPKVTAWRILAAARVSWV